MYISNLFAVGGWTLKHIHDCISKIVAQAPDFVVLQCGTNALCSCRSPLSLVHALLNTASRIRIASGAETIFVCQLLHRSKVGKKYIRSPEELVLFNKNVDQANYFLRNLSPEHIGVKYWKHKGLSKSSDTLCSDGVHLSSRGQFKYYKSLRGAILFGMRHQTVGQVWPPCLSRFYTVELPVGDASYLLLVQHVLMRIFWLKKHKKTTYILKKKNEKNN